MGRVVKHYLGKLLLNREFKDRTSWYDGYLFEILMGKRAQEIFVKPISALIEDGSSVIDIGCGIGSLLLNLSPACGKLIGIDASSKMINYAIKRTMNKKYPNVEFHHLCASLLSEVFPNKFDYGIMGQILHEAPEDVRDTILKGAEKITKKLIIADYLSPLPQNTYGIMIRFVESIAGSEHNRNFKSWQLHGGIDSFITNHGLHVESVQPYQFKGKEMGIGKIVKVHW
jgi:ubiquinone/menaquinone biosynthesis C-methylase UbiE